MSDNTADSAALFVQQTSDVQEMRNHLLSFDRRDPSAARKALQNVTLLRVYHQLERIVRYTEMMDRIENRIYQSIDMKLANADPDDEELYYTLIPIAERLEKMMIDSHKLLEPYLNFEQLNSLEITQEEDPANSFTSMLLEQESREKVRTGVQQLMDIINTFDSTAKDASSSESEPQSEPESEVQSKAQEALAKLKEQQEQPSEEQDG